MWRKCEHLALARRRCAVEIGSLVDSRGSSKVADRSSVFDPAACQLQSCTLMMKTQTRFASTLRIVAMGTTLLLVAPVARAEPEPETDGDTPPPRLASGLKLSLSVEPGVAVALTDPQSERTDTGLGQTLKLLFGVTRYLAVGPTAAYTTLPAATSMPTSGAAWAFGGGARMMRPHDAVGFYGVSPWIDADLLYVRTGGLDRLGFASAVGVAVPIDDRRRFWVGPYARYFQIVQGERAGFDNRDAKVLELGISLEAGFGLEPTRTRIASAEPTRMVPAAVEVAEPDRDQDGVSDATDLCPDVAGPVASAGCPAYEKVVVKQDKLELKERIAFAWDSALLDETSRPLLDEVAQALKDNLNFRVQVDGHTSSEGGDSHNQVLSEQRAAVVLDYLVARGVAKSRLVSKGFSSSVPAATNVTAAGRVTNRRVEFVVDFIIIKEGNTP
jgi:outer membrane protein OmpA-like peptidoglycan-associated protein